MDDSRQRTGYIPNYLIILLGLAILLGGYTILRYRGWWGTGDTAVFTKTIFSIMDSARLVPEQDVYANGYGYQILAIFVIETTGISLGNFQIYLSMLLVSWVVIPAWLAYREFTHSSLAASLATLILLVQPEFLFPLLRGTHEKFTRGLMFICLYLLLRSLRSRSARQAGLFAFCFYLCAYALISFNTFMSTSFILVIILALGLVWVSSIWSSNTRSTVLPVINKLFYVIASLLVIAIIFTFYSYTPAQQQLRVLQSIGDRLALLFLQVEDSSSNPYQVVNAGWVSLPVYFLVSLANWILLATSLMLWLKQSYNWLVQRTYQPAMHEIIVWALYAASAFLGFGSILVDTSGAIASNLQHRIFPSFAMIAAPVTGAWLVRVKLDENLGHKLTWAVASSFMGILMVLSIFKATNEPLLSNTWLFYTPAERQSVIWAEDKLCGLNLWTGPGRAVADGYSTFEDGRALDISLDTYLPEPTTYDFLISEVTRLQAQRLSRSLPIQVDSLIIYDNGEAQIYHRRPITPFQK